MAPQSPAAMSADAIDAATVGVTVDGEDFPTIDYGDGPPVLLLHGFPDSRRLWRHQVPRLAEEGYRVLAPDLRGFGDAPKPQATEPYRLSAVMGDITGLLDALDVSTVSLVGHDWGAAVGWLTAAIHADRIDRFAALCVGAPGTPGTQTIEQREKSWYFYFFQFDVAEAWLRHDDWALLREWTRGNGETEHYVEALAREGALTAGLNWYRANVHPGPPGDDPPGYPDIQSPTLGVWPDGDDYLTEEHVTGSTAKVAGEWRYERIDGASHWVMLDRPAELNALLAEFLAG